MKLHSIKITNFQSFGEEPTEFTLEEITYLIGPNGSGKQLFYKRYADCLPLIHHCVELSALISIFLRMNLHPQIKERYVLKLILFFLKQQMLTIIQQ